MPLVRCVMKNGKKGWKYGKNNKSCFPTKKEAMKQAYIIMKKEGKIKGGTEEIYIVKKDE